MPTPEHQKIITDLDEKSGNLKTIRDHILVPSEEAVPNCNLPLIQMQDLESYCFYNQQDEIELTLDILIRGYNSGDYCY
jgi:hypothetical protein